LFAAAFLDISEATACAHMKHIYAKTGTVSFAALIGQVHRSTSRT
jgi:DNA-binding CsgD family transcriptional regulator